MFWFTKTLNSRVLLILILMQMLESEWLSYQTPSVITSMCGSILAVTIHPFHPPFLAVVPLKEHLPFRFGGGEFFKHFCSSGRRKSSLYFRGTETKARQARSTRCTQGEETGKKFKKIIFSHSSLCTQLAFRTHLAFVSVHLKYAKKFHRSAG